MGLGYGWTGRRTSRTRHVMASARKPGTVLPLLPRPVRSQAVEALAASSSSGGGAGS